MNSDAREIKILLIEDNPGDVRLIKEMVAEAEGMNLAVEDAPGLTSGVERLSRGGIDIVLLDLNLSDSTGLDTFRKLHARFPDLPIIILTVIYDEDLAVRAVREGAQDYLNKNTLGRLLLLHARTYGLERKRTEVVLRKTLERFVKVLEETVETLASVVETRDPYTAGHQRRTSQLAALIAKAMGLPEEQLIGIRMAALIHDIGKIEVPADILNKPAALNPEEMKLIRKHPVAGYNMLKAIEFPWKIAQIVLQHHERVNGSGYPKGLTEPEILVESKILAVADVIEAMCFQRPYRPARGMEQALEEIMNNRGRLYDPGVVDVCVSLFKENKFRFA
jgi:putative nucleotidyltransferase with HDIG domain